MLYARIDGRVVATARLELATPGGHAS
jgi:hypothetical protein